MCNRAQINVEIVESTRKHDEGSVGEGGIQEKRIVQIRSTVAVDHQKGAGG